MADEKKPYQKPAAPVADNEHANFKYIVRIANTDLNGKKQLFLGIQKIKGISFMFANAICAVTHIEPTKRIGDLSEADVSKLDVLIRNPKSANLPEWLLNRRNDYDSGEDKHLIGADLTFTNENDLRRLKKIKSYRGIRHMLGAPVRGQRTRANFRKNKGKVASIKRAAVAKSAAPAKKDAKPAGKK